MKKTGRIFFILFLAFYQICGAQNTIVDSLKNLLNKTMPDTSRVNILIAICQNEYRSSPDSAIYHGNTALNLSEKLYYQKGLANAYKYIGMGHYFLGKYPEAINYWQQSLSSFEAIGDKVGVSNILNNIGAVYNNQGDDTKALEFYLRSLKAAEEVRDTNRIVVASINIGTIYLKKNTTRDKAQVYYLTALPLIEFLKNYVAEGTVSVNLGEIYFGREQYDTALYYYEKSLNAFRKSKSGNIPYTLTNIGKVYMKRGDFQKAVEFQKEGYEIAKQSDAKLEMTATLLGLAETYSTKGDLKASISTYNDAREIAEEIGAKNELRVAYEGLAKSYAKLKDYGNAFKYQTFLTDIKDTLYVAANDRKIQSLQFNFELDKRETQINLLTKDRVLQEVVIQKQKFAKNTFIIGFILTILVALQTYRNYRRKVKTNELLSKQKNEIEIHDKNLTASINYAQRIQTAMFPSNDILSADLFEYFILLKPLHIVSGDFYWFKKNKNSIFVAVADCTGHGVPGAFMSILGLAFLNELVNKDVAINANEVLAQLKDHVIKSLHQTLDNKYARDGIEMALIILDLEYNKLQFSGACRPLYMIRDNQLHELLGEKMPLGIYDDKRNPFTNQEIVFKENDIVYLFSDGYVDQFGGPEKKTFKSKNFKELLLNNCHLPMNEQKEVLETTLEEWKADTEQTDDILVIGIKFKFGAGE